jgi:hypothetical protein
MSVEQLAVLIGRWDIVGRSVGADHDNIRGEVEITPILDGGVLRLTGTMRVDDTELESLELVWPDPDGGFAAHVYSSSGQPLDYRWERHGTTLIHAGAGATYTGTISENGSTITGSWLPDPGQPAHPGSAYDSTMVRRADA